MKQDVPEDGKVNFSAEELPLTDEMIVSFLSDNPDFFIRNSTLLTSMRLVDPQRGTVSLVERQQQQLRQKSHALEEEITQLMSVAHHNEQLFAHYSDLYLDLLDCGNATQLLDTLLKSTTEKLSLSAVKLWLKTPVAIDHTCIVTNDCAGIMQNRLTKDDYYFGRLQQTEQELIFSQHSIGSVVLIKLTSSEDNQCLGFLAISSEDAEHFDPRMDTLLLSQFKKLVAKLLQQKLYQV